MTRPSPDDTASRLAALEAGGNGDTLMEAVRLAMNDDAPEVRARAVELAAVGLAPEALIALLGQGQAVTRRASAVEALVRQGQRAVPALVASVHRPNADTDAVLFALLALGRIPGAASLQVLVSFARHDDLKLAQGALEGLGTSGTGAATPALLQALGSDPWRTFAALVSLGAVGDGRAVGALERLSTDELYGFAAQQALAGVQSRLTTPQRGPAT